jgi:ATPase subunit of ABC transporter with duplicated ATPase domains
MKENINDTELTVNREDQKRVSNNNQFVDAPLQLIDFKEGNFELNEKAMKTLNEITEEIIIVSIVGKARTGKSYLMNLLLDNTGKSKGVLIIYFSSK